MKINRLLIFSIFSLSIIGCNDNNSNETVPNEVIPNEVIAGELIPDDAIFVENITTLEAVLETAIGGEFIVLQNGDYGTLEIDALFSTKVTIKSANKLGASIDDLILEGSSNLIIDGILIEKNIAGSTSNDIVIKNSKMNTAIFKGSKNIIFTNNDLKYANFNDSSYFEITNNYIHHASADLLHVKGNAHHFTIKNNIFFDTIPDAEAHSDALQMTGNANGTPHDFILRGNYLYDDPNTDIANGKLKKLQGFFLADARDKGYYNITIEENVINVSNTSNSIAVLGAGENVTIRNNTLLPTSVDSGGGIRVTQHEGTTGDNIIVTKNVASIPKYGGVPNIMANDNIFYNTSGNSIDLTTLFKNPRNFGTWKIFIPKEDSSIDFGNGYGAEKRVQEMLNGENLHESLKD